MLLKSLVAEYFSARPATGTRHQYDVVVNLVKRWQHDGNPTVAVFTKQRFLHFMAWVQPGRAASTVNKKREILLRLWDFAFAMEYTDQRVPPMNIIAPPLPEEKKNPQSWTMEQMSSILRHVSAAPLPKKWTPEQRDAVWTARILCLYDTGARIEALRKCRVTDLRGDRLHLEAQHDKTLTEHTPRLSEQTLNAVAQMLELMPRYDDDYLFPDLISTQRLRDGLTQILKAAGLDTSRYSKFHRFRRTNVTQTAIAAGIPSASQAIDHRDQQTTERYLDRTQLPKVDAVDHLPRPVFQVV